MGQKVNPYGFRLGVTTDWKSRWFDDRRYQDSVVEDWKIRNYLMTELEQAAVSHRGRAHARPVANRPAHGAPRHRHRPSRGGSRPIAHRPGQDHPQPEGAAEHPGDQAAGAGRGPDRPGYRRPACSPDQLPPRDEACASDRAEGGWPGHQGAVHRPPWWFRDGPQGEL